MNKKKRISHSAPHPPQSRSSRMRPILSLRSTRMKKMKNQITDTADLGVTVTSVNPFWLPAQKPKTEMTLAELRDDISRYQRTNRFITCSYVMGVSCAGTDRYDEDTPKTQENFEKQTVYGKWRMAGGICRESANAVSNVDSSPWFLDEKCSSRCRGPTSSGNYECKCSLLANGQSEC